MTDTTRLIPHGTSLSVGNASIPVPVSDEQMRQEAQPSFLQSPKDWHLDRIGQRDALKQQKKKKELTPPEYTLEEEAFVLSSEEEALFLASLPSQTTCEICGVFVGPEQSEKKLAYFPIYGKQKLLLRTKTYLIKDQLLRICGGCMQDCNKRPVETTRYMLVFSAREWDILQGKTQAEIKKALNWIRHLWECILFGRIQFFIVLLSCWIYEQEQQAQRQQTQKQQTLRLSATFNPGGSGVQIHYIPGQPEQQARPLTSLEQMRLEQQRLFFARPVNPQR